MNDAVDNISRSLNEAMKPGRRVFRTWLRKSEAAAV